MRDSSKAVLQHSVVASLQLVFDILQLHGSMPPPKPPDLPSLPLLFFNLPVHTETTSAWGMQERCGVPTFFKTSSLTFWDDMSNS